MQSAFYFLGHLPLLTNIQMWNILKFYDFLIHELLLFYMHWCFDCRYVCVRVLDPLELELQMLTARWVLGIEGVCHNTRLNFALLNPKKM